MPTSAESLAYAIEVLQRKEVTYALGLHVDHLDGQEVPDGAGGWRPMTSDDLADALRSYGGHIAQLRELAAGTAP